MSTIAHKEFLKSKSGLVFYDYTILIFSGVFILAVSLILFFSLLGYGSHVSGSVEINGFSSGILFEIIAGLCILVSGILNYLEKKKEVMKKIYIQNSGAHQADLESYDEVLGTHEEDEKNMQLPI